MMHVIGVLTATQQADHLKPTKRLHGFNCD